MKTVMAARCRLALTLAAAVAANGAELPLARFEIEPQTDREDESVHP